jgi:hypothetical protein
MKQEQANFSLQTFFLYNANLIISNVKSRDFFLEHTGEKQRLLSLSYIILVHTRQYKGNSMGATAQKDT